MRLHALQHVPFEGPANLARWATDRGHELTVSRRADGDPLPSVTSFDWLVVLGGPMGVHDDKEYPWLVDEQAHIRTAIDAGRTVLGICLGAQLVAAVLGADITENEYREIGWFPVTRSDRAGSSRLTAALPSTFEAFHWHGDTFEIPPGATRLYGSEACRNQAFLFNDTVVGLQFHLESTPESVRDLWAASTPDSGPFVQTAEGLLGNAERFDVLKGRCYALLDALAEASRG